MFPSGRIGDELGSVRHRLFAEDRSSLRNSDAGPTEMFVRIGEVRIDWWIVGLEITLIVERDGRLRFDRSEFG